MADISRIASPMSLCEEDLFDVHKTVERKKQELKQLQKTPASFFVGSVDVINERISSLTNQLSAYDSKLAIESQSSYGADSSSINKQRTTMRSSRSARAREEKDVRDFEGAVSNESVFASGEKSIKKRISSKKSDEPQLVELQQYPGFDPLLPTPLPHSLEINNILNIVVKAQTDLRRKPTYKRDFDKMFYSKQNKTILQDMFWWYFLNKLHPNPDIQSKLFRRIAKNYITIFLMPIKQRYKNVFLMSYGDLLAQSVYCTFCRAFPQSWRQFDELNFKEDLLVACITWVSGIQPRPGIYYNWNYSVLEPAGMRKDESIDNDDNDANDAVSNYRSNFTDNLTSSVSRESNARSKSIPKSLSKASTNRSDALSGISSFKSKTHEISDHQINQINEGVKKDEFATAKQCRHKAPHERSCAAGQAVEFEKCLFNLYGGSPLLREYYKEKKWKPTSGVDHLVRRTQIRAYAPVTAQTYDDVIKETSEEVRRIGLGFRKLNSDFIKGSQVFEQKLKRDEEEYIVKATKLLSKPRRVRRLSTMILMDMKRNKEDMTSTPVGVNAALQAALSSERVE